MAARAARRSTRPSRPPRRLDRAADRLEDSSFVAGTQQVLESGRRLAAKAAQQAEALEGILTEAKQGTGRVLYRATTGMHAVAETSRRAAQAPAPIARELRDAGKAYARGIVAGIALYAIGGVCLAIALVSFSIALATGLDLWLGAPWGAVIVGAIYAVAGTILVLRARRRGRDNDAVDDHLQAARGEIDHVLEPVRRWTRRPARKEA